VLHVTFGSVLDRFGDRLKAALAVHEEAYSAALATHFEKHLAPFKGGDQAHTVLSEGDR